MGYIMSAIGFATIWVMAWKMHKEAVQDAWNDGFMAGYYYEETFDTKED